MKKRIRAVLGILLIAAMLIMPATPAIGKFIPNPQTNYAKSFVDACDGQQWFIEEVERLLNLQQKTISSLESADDLSGIRAIGLEGKDITGTIPAAIGELKSLEYLFLSDNKLTGSIPGELLTLTKLKNIDLSGNQLEGEIPQGFGAMPDLKVLMLDHNSFSGAVPADLGNSSAMETLSMSDNKLTGGIPAALGGISTLKYLNLSENELGGEIPDISSLKQLKVLSLWGCGLVGDLPAEIFSLGELEAADLAQNKLGGTLPELSGAPKINYIALDRNILRGHVPADWKTREDAGCTIYLDNNYLTGDVLKGMAHSEYNFVDGAENPQYRLTVKSEYAEIWLGRAVDIFDYIQKMLITTGEKSKVELRPEDFELTYDDSKVQITVDEKGIHVKALKSISRAERFPLEIRIRANDGSDYSKVVLLLTTDHDYAVNYHEPYINGMPDGTFGPERPVTREQAAKMLMMAMGEAASTEQTSRYTDVEIGRWSLPWIEAASEKGFLTGYPDGRFGPADPITRAEMSAVVVRAAEFLKRSQNSESIKFSDVKEDMWYASYVSRAAQYGLIRGYSDGTFGPEKNITRAEAVVIINRLMRRDPSTAAGLSGKECPFSDMKPEHWAYMDILEASVTHVH